METLTFDTTKYILVNRPTVNTVEFYIIQPNNLFYVDDEHEIFDTIEECENRLLWWYFVDLNRFPIDSNFKRFYPFSRILTSEEFISLKENNPELFDRYTKR